MNAAQTDAWISCYLYYKTDPTDLLVTMVQPLVRQLTDKQLVEQFFFIRYSDSRGLHIRLRLLLSGAPARRSVTQQIKKAFPDAVFIAYVPEVERYGGPAGLPIAEQLFEASSKAVLRLLQQESWSYKRTLASALQLHIGMLEAFGLSREEVVALFKHIAATESGEDRVQQLEQSFTAQREVLVPQLSTLWAACEKKIDFPDEWFAEWRQDMATIGTQIRQADSQHILELRSSEQHASQLWFLYESYIHMTNNRLGVSRQDEGFIAYLLQRSLS